MVTIVKHEWHSHDRQYAFEIDEVIISEIYPDLDEEECCDILEQINQGTYDIDQLMNDADDNGVDIDWEFQYDDCWTDRKGGYDITYELGDENSYHSEPEPDPPSHKCTKCKWQGNRYSTITQYLREDGSVIEDYYSSDEVSDIEKEICPMCDSDTELTEFGIEDDKQRKERQAKWDIELAELADSNEVACYSCDEMVSEDELVEMSGQLICPHCGEGWVMPEDRDEELESDVLSLEEALGKLKNEFEELKETHDK